MMVEQAIFTSARTSRCQGYHLVARSPGIRDRVAQFLARWGPTHGSLASKELNTSSANYVPIDGQWTAVSRTLYGGPEYSARGASQVVTVILAVRREQLAGYDYNPASLIRTALLLGHLRLRNGLLDDPPAVPLPDRVPRHCLGPPAESPGRDQAILERSLQMVKTERLAVVGVANPLITAERIIQRVSREERLELSFATGLTPSQHRRFRLHMLPGMDAALHGRLSAQGIRFLAAAV